MFTRSFPLFSIFGFRISLDLSWFVLAALITWSLATGLFPESLAGRDTGTYYAMGAIAALGMFASIVFHELAHSLVARYYDIKIAGITLFIFGGVAELEDEPPTAKSEFLVAIAGPISSVILAGALYLFAESLSGVAPDEIIVILSYLFMINLVLAIFNLIPAFPLDGGRMLRAALWGWQGDLRKATRIASYLGAGLGIALMGFGAYNASQGGFVGGMWQILIGYFIFNAAGRSRRQTEIMEKLRGIKVRQLMRTPLPALPAELPAEEIARHPDLGRSGALFPVLSQGRLVGVLRPSTLQSVAAGKRAAMTVGEAAAPLGSADTLSPDESAIAALRQLMRAGKADMLVVADDGSPTGTIGPRDIFGYLDQRAQVDRAAARESTGSA